LHPDGVSKAVLKIDIAENRFPCIARDAGLSIRALELVALVKDTGGWTPTNVDVTPPDGQRSTTQLSSSESLYGGQPSATVSYESSPAKPGLWTVAVDISGPGAPSNWIDDLVTVITYDIVIPE
jgi:hypothetical protein